MGFSKKRRQETVPKLAAQTWYTPKKVDKQRRTAADLTSHLFYWSSVGLH